MKMLVQQAVGYGAASLLALAVDMSILWYLVCYCGFGHLGAASLSFLAGAGVAYFFSVHWVFKDHRLRNRSAEFATFIAIGTMGLAVNACVIDVAVRFWGLHIMMAKCAAAACTFMCNFFARRQLLFVPPGNARVRDLSP
jgi:putative flippase GtrA